MSDTLLKVESLVKRYPLRGGLFGGVKGEVKAVEGVSFNLAAGQTLGLVGESGCGKSTLGRTLMRLEEPTEGAVRFRGKDIMTASKAEVFAMRRNLAMVFQDPYSSLNPRMTVGEIVREPLDVHKLGSRAEQNKRVEDLLLEVGLRKEAMERYPHEFSGGQRQRVGIARALALEPEIIVADEPVSALDVSVQAQVLNLLVDLQRRRGLSYIFISHDLSVVEYISDHVAIMYLGRIVETGTTNEIFDSPRHPYTRALLDAVPVPDPARRRARPAIKGETPSPVNPPAGCAFHPRCPFAQEKCKAAIPTLEPTTAGSKHMVACIRKDEIG